MRPGVGDSARNAWTVVTGEFLCGAGKKNLTEYSVRDTVRDIIMQVYYVKYFKDSARVSSSG